MEVLLGNYVHGTSFMGILVCSAPRPYSVSEVDTLVIHSRVVAHYAGLVTVFEGEGGYRDRSGRGESCSL